MAITEARPASLEFDALAGTEFSFEPSSEQPRRRTWVRRLPFVLAVLALAAGYAIGHATNDPTVKIVEPPGAVTADQINAMLQGTNGQAVENDRGFSLLENGVQHNHGWELPMTPAQRALLAHQLTLARETALRYPTLADAKRAGMFRAGPFAPGLGTHMVMVKDIGYAPGAGPMTDAQIEHPLAWIYDGTKPDSPVAGLFYNAYVPNPAGFAGPNDVWHIHRNICTKYVDGAIQAPLGADADVTQAQCAAIGGSFMAQTGYLLHVWVVPGYEDSQGVFAHLNPSVMCNDGTYYTVNISQIGYRTSACRDGSE
jgi:hypothetical protein